MANTRLETLAGDIETLPKRSFKRTIKSEFADQSSPPTKKAGTISDKRKKQNREAAARSRHKRVAEGIVKTQRIELLEETVYRQQETIAALQNRINELEANQAYFSHGSVTSSPALTVSSDQQLVLNDDLLSDQFDISNQNAEGNGCAHQVKQELTESDDGSPLSLAEIPYDAADDLFPKSEEFPSSLSNSRFSLFSMSVTKQISSFSSEETSSTFQFQPFLKR